VFWKGFFAGWVLYFGINFSFAMVESGRLAWSLALAGTNTLPPLLTGGVVALNRRRLFQPDWGSRKTVLVHVGVGAAFAVSTGALLLLMIELTGLQTPELQNAGPATRLLAISVSAAFLYAVFAGVVMWAESVRRVDESTRIAAREAVLRAEAEAKAVRAQFNPHFVFNTLHSLMLLVREDPAAAERAIEDVATLIRYASIIQRRDIDAVPLAKELEVVRRYVDLERLRLDGRLEVSWSIDVDPTTVTIPAFALQTLVENAIKHGIEPSPRGGRVLVSARLADDVLVMKVEDDGVGADPGGVTAQSGHGLGLLRQRLDSRHGGDGGLSWSTRAGDGFSVTVHVPATRPADEPALDVIEGRAVSGAGAPV
jgi:two-component sensor histidine kinase